MNWTKETPTTGKYYWFYGYQSEFSKKNNRKGLVFVRLQHLPNSIMYVANGAFMYPKNSDGYWLPIEEPTLP